MKNIRILLMTILSMMVLSTHAQMLSKGVSKELADHRKANVSNVVYDLTFKSNGKSHHQFRPESEGRPDPGLPGRLQRNRLCLLW